METIDRDSILAIKAVIGPITDSSSLQFFSGSDPAGARPRCMISPKSSALLIPSSLASALKIAASSRASCARSSRSGVQPFVARPYGSFDDSDFADIAKLKGWEYNSGEDDDESYKDRRTWGSDGRPGRGDYGMSEGFGGVNCEQ
jgi:hypothetical protein